MMEVSLSPVTHKEKAGNFWKEADKANVVQGVAPASAPPPPATPAALQSVA